MMFVKCERLRNKLFLHKLCPQFSLRVSYHIANISLSFVIFLRLPISLANNLYTTFLRYNLWWWLPDTLCLWQHSSGRREIKWRQQSATTNVPFLVCQVTMVKLWWSLRRCDEQGQSPGLGQFLVTSGWVWAGVKQGLVLWSGITIDHQESNHQRVM